MIDEYLANLIDESDVGKATGQEEQVELMRIAKITHQNIQEKVLVHGHCYQKIRKSNGKLRYFGTSATQRILEIFGYDVKMVEAGCCGMAGAFGYEKEHFEISMKVGELALLPAVRLAEENTWIAASGVSCRSQIMDGAQRKCVHPIELIARLL